MTSPSAPAQAERLLQDAEAIARSMRHAYLGVEHVFLAFLPTRLLIPAFRSLGIEIGTAEVMLRDLLPKGEDAMEKGTLPRTPRLKRVLDRAMEAALNESSHDLLPSHILRSLLEETEGMVALALADLGTAPRAVLDALENPADKASPRTGKEKPKATPLLDKLGRDLTHLAREQKLDPVIGRGEELRRLMQILTRKTKNVPILIGEPGVGKTAVVLLLAQRLAKGNVPQSLQGKRLVELPLGGIVAGTSHRGELEERVQKIVQEASSDPDLILFIDEIHGLAGAGGTHGGLDVGNMLKPGLSDGSLRVIGATTSEEYQKYLAKDAALERRLQPILVNEPSEEETLQILQGLKPRYEKYHGVTFEEEAVLQAVKLSIRYLPDRRLPDKALDLLDEAASRVKIRTNVGPGPTVSKDEIAEVVSLWTGIPVRKLSTPDKERFLQLEERLKSKVIGQDEAANRVAEVVRISRAGLANPKKPVGIFLFLGPTGVGKTEMAKALAEILFGGVEAMIRIDMSEYKEKHTVARLIGAPPGYVGHDEEGQLTRAVHARPYALILFDEVEKAHPEVLDLFLQIFEDGRLTDSKGRTVNFTNTLIIMTSNIGSELILSRVQEGTDKEGMREQLMNTVRASFRPEFLNRIDEILVFNPLSRRDLDRIVELQLAELKERLRDQKMNLEVAPAATELLIVKGYDPSFGARPLRRAVQQILAKPLAEALLQGKFTEGDTIVADAQGDTIILRRGGGP